MRSGSSYAQEPTIMKALATTWVLLTSVLVAAQSDTTVVPRDTTTHPGLPMLNLGVSSDRGAYAEVINTDTVKDKSHFTIDTKYKRITVTTEPKPWASVGDSIAEVLKLSLIHI